MHRSVWLALLVVVCACGAARPLSEDSPPPTASTAECVVCHGARMNAPGAPTHSTENPDRSGAHQLHLVGLSMTKPLPCGECHVVPSAIMSPGHGDGEVTVAFDAPGATGVAHAGGARPTWNRETATCSSVYCHGATLMGDAALEPVWDRASGPRLFCGGCHALPPPPSRGHPARSACPDCHDTLRPDGSLDLEKHIDGKVQLAIGSCTTCHGDPDRPPATAAAPPFDASGNTSSPAVGAHLRHLTGGAIAGPIACRSCHVVPTDTGHVDGISTPEFGGIARARGAQAAWDPARRTCSTHCHGATSSGGTLTAPGWNAGPSQAACGSCHGLPPTSRHPDVLGGAPSCNGCHPDTVKPDGTIDVAGGLHVNGVVDVNFSARGCSSCHGGTLSGTDGDGVDLAAAPRSGAHVGHLTASIYRARCRDCHPVPTSMTHSDGTVQLEFWTSATQWNGTTCSTSYCHGASSRGTNGGAGTVMTWSPPAPQLDCVSCHHGPHYQTHSGGGECEVCHEHVVGNGIAFVNPVLHVNGRPDHVNCSIGCHAF